MRLGVCGFFIKVIPPFGISNHGPPIGSAVDPLLIRSDPLKIRSFCSGTGLRIRLEVFFGLRAVGVSAGRQPNQGPSRRQGCSTSWLCACLLPACLTKALRRVTMDY